MSSNRKRFACLSACVCVSESVLLLLHCGNVEKMRASAPLNGDCLMTRMSNRKRACQLSLNQTTTGSDGTDHVQRRWRTGGVAETAPASNLSSTQGGTSSSGASLTLFPEDGLWICVCLWRFRPPILKHKQKNEKENPLTQTRLNVNASSGPKCI